MSKQKATPKHGARSARARELWRKGVTSYAEIARRTGLSNQGARNAINAMDRVGKAKAEAGEEGAAEQ